MFQVQQHNVLNEAFAWPSEYPLGHCADHAATTRTLLLQSRSVQGSMASVGAAPLGDSPATCWASFGRG
jgi:hypothetical protein